MIKKFESFKSDISFEEAFKYVRLFNNDTYDVPEHIIHKFIPDSFFDEEYFLIRDIEDIQISEGDKKLVIDCYNEINNEYNLDSIPDYFDIERFFLDLMDIKDPIGNSIVSFSYLFKDKTIRFEINTIPSVRYFPNKDKTEFDVKEWDEISQEILPICSRLKDAGYKLKTYLTHFGNIVILISF
jgi:hypothetical protein